MAALLALDSSGERVHIGLAVDGRYWLADEAGAAQASARLLPGVQRLLREAALGVRELDAIAFGRGPGAFTGLRAACSAAQGLGAGAGRPVLPIDTLMAVAESARARVGAEDAWVVMDARMGEIYAARYGWTGADWQTLYAPELVTPEALRALCARLPSAWLVGSAAHLCAEMLQAQRVKVDGKAQPDARALLACAGRAMALGSAVDAAAAIPLYLRNKVALTSAEREAASRTVA